MSVTATWTDVQLGDIGQSLIGLTYSPNNVKRSGTLVLRSSNIQDGQLAFEDNVYVDSPIPQKVRVRKNDILICVRNGSRRLIGKSVMLDDRVVGQTFGAFMAVYRSNVNPFLQYFFQSDDFKKQIDEHLGATINQITNASLNSFVVALPDEAEQEVIVSKLQDADRLIATIERLIAKKRAIKQGMLEQLLTGRIRLSESFRGWTTRPLSEVAVLLDNLRVPLSGAQRLGRSGRYPYCGANGVLDYIDDYMIDDDVVLLAEDGGNFDQWRTRPIAYRMNGKIWVNNHAHVLKGGPAIETGFLFYALEHRDITSFISNGTRSKLTRAQLVRIEVPTPDSVEEQHAIASALADADDQIAVLKIGVAKARNIKTGMIQQLLSGRTRLPVEAAA